MSEEAKQIMVTIWCTAYNHEPYIRQCLDGFVMQRTNFRFEAIVHDDASTDNTAAIVREYAEKYPEIIKPIYETENQYSKRDGSLDRIMTDHTLGKYIAICEGDDYWIDPLKLQKQVNIMENHQDYLLCTTNSLIIWDKGLFAPSYFKKYYFSHEVKIEEIVGNWMFATATILFKKSLLSNYPEWTKKVYFGDMTLMLIAVHLGKIYVDDSLTTVYRKAVENNSVTKRLVNRMDYVRHQQVILYEEYQKWTNYRYGNLVNATIKKLKKSERYYKLRKISRVIPYILMPVYSLKLKFNGL